MNKHIEQIARDMAGCYWDKEYSLFSATDKKSYCDSHYKYYLSRAKAAYQSTIRLLIERSAQADLIYSGGIEEYESQTTKFLKQQLGDEG